jgi:hypothetical protein
MKNSGRRNHFERLFAFLGCDGIISHHGQSRPDTLSRASSSDGSKYNVNCLTTDYCNCLGAIKRPAHWDPSPALWLISGFLSPIRRAKGVGNPCNLLQLISATPSHNSYNSRTDPLYFQLVLATV